MLARLLLLVACLGVAATSFAQTGHPAKGSWSGDLDPDSTNSTRVRLLLDAWDGELSGSVNPGRNGIEMSKVTLDADTWTLTIRAPMPEGELVLTGTLNNLGSWTNRKYTGSYTLGREKGSFAFTMN